MKNFTLDVDYECDFSLFGLVSSTRDYTLAWTLNRALRLRLIKQPELLLNLLSRGRLVFTHYLHATETVTFRLLRNRSVVPSNLKKPFLAPDIKEYDYLLAVTNGTGVLADEELVEQLAALDAVQYVCQFDPNTLKYKENLIL
ncbi:IPExxxVDY family protein [Hymenobacter sp. BT664]|uniref:IPExxxVDY family protein n=1 Tax=Hymenobacter montanus TaxID=2771359 RepID=A0A927B9B1_9BACT|nr:IPExxxVDY family protein [Hymenobacter montanus]MBD2766507.1 IPExxxVDY family protein [Hymenobacter montanus]